MWSTSYFYMLGQSHIIVKVKFNISMRHKSEAGTVTVTVQDRQLSPL